MHRQGRRMPTDHEPSFYLSFVSEQNVFPQSYRADKSRAGSEGHLLNALKSDFGCTLACTLSVQCCPKVKYITFLFRAANKEMPKILRISFGKPPKLSAQTFSFFCLLMSALL